MLVLVAAYWHLLKLLKWRLLVHQYLHANNVKAESVHNMGFDMAHMQTARGGINILHVLSNDRT